MERRDFLKWASAALVLTATQRGKVLAELGADEKGGDAVLASDLNSVGGLTWIAPPKTLPDPREDGLACYYEDKLWVSIKGVGWAEMASAT